LRGIGYQSVCAVKIWSTYEPRLTLSLEGKIYEMISSKHHRDRFYSHTGRYIFYPASSPTTYLSGVANRTARFLRVLHQSCSCACSRISQITDLKNSSTPCVTFRRSRAIIVFQSRTTNPTTSALRLTEFTGLTPSDTRTYITFTVEPHHTRMRRGVITLDLHLIPSGKISSR
jgi:hypothetical protein